MSYQQWVKYTRQFRGQTMSLKWRGVFFGKILHIPCLENGIPETKALAGICLSTRVQTTRIVWPHRRTGWGFPTCKARQSSRLLGRAGMCSAVRSRQRMPAIDIVSELLGTPSSEPSSLGEEMLTHLIQFWLQTVAAHLSCAPFHSVSSCTDMLR